MARRSAESGSGSKGETATREHLTRPRVVAAALAIVDRDGLDGLTMRALGRELEVDPMAVYYWFPNKQAILQGVVEAILSDISVPADWAPERWQDAALAIAREYRAALLRHPNALPVASTQPVMTMAGIGMIEQALRGLMAGGLTPGAALEAVDTAAAFVIGDCMVHAGVTPGTEPVAAEDIAQAYAGIDAIRFPNLARAMAEAATLLGDDELQFQTGLDALVRGLELSFRERRLLA
jgi:TetR/AcrR family tetracycline transcriptional repressor